MKDRRTSGNTALPSSNVVFRFGFPGWGGVCVGGGVGVEGEVWGGGWACYLVRTLTGMLCSAVQVWLPGMGRCVCRGRCGEVDGHVNWCTH